MNKSDKVIFDDSQYRELVRSEVARLQRLNNATYNSEGHLNPFTTGRVSGLNMALSLIAECIEKGEQ